jgi:hypothetical protein
MKTTILYSLIILMTLPSFSTRPTTSDARAKSGEELAILVISALRNESAQEFSSLFPPLQDLHLIMERTGSLYGSNLQEAKNEFTSVYHGQVVPAMNRSFLNLIEAGKASGVKWKSAEIKEVKVSENADGTLSMIISFSSEEKIHQLYIEKVLVLDSFLAISQYSKLV